MSLTTFYITNDPNIALAVERAGVSRVWIDLEVLGKEERQKGMNTVKSNHSIQDIKTIAPLLTKAQMMVRVNPWNKDSKTEIDEVIAAGAEIVMLPMWKSTVEVKSFISAINHRAKVSLLLETKEAVNCLDEVLELDGIDEIHIGLNDLHLSYGLTFMFELLTNGVVESLVNKIRAKNIVYGIGGVSHLGDGLVPAELIILEYYRLGSKNVILSRGFCDQSLPLAEFEKEFCNNMTKMKAYEKEITNEKIAENQQVLKDKVNMVVELIKERRKNAS